MALASPGVSACRVPVDRGVSEGDLPGAQVADHVFTAGRAVHVGAVAGTASPATALVPPTPESQALAERLGYTSQRVLTILRTAAPIVAGIACRLPVVLAAGAVALTGAALVAPLARLHPRSCSA